MREGAKEEGCPKAKYLTLLRLIAQSEMRIDN